MRTSQAASVERGPLPREREATLALTTFVAALGMNHVHQGSYLP
jgi:hypothetical protein